MRCSADGGSSCFGEDEAKGACVCWGANAAKHQLVRSQRAEAVMQLAEERLSFWIQHNVVFKVELKPLKRTTCGFAPVSRVL